MDSAGVKRIVTLNRQIKIFEAMVKSGQLQRAEADIAIGEAQAELKSIRAQATLSLQDGNSEPSKSPKR